MNTKHLTQSLTVLMLFGVALGAAHAENAANEPASEVRAADNNAAPAEMKIQLPPSDQAAAKVDSVAVLQNADSNADSTAPAAAAAAAAAAAPAPAEAPAAKPSMLQRAVSGASDFYDRAKTFVLEAIK